MQENSGTGTWAALQDGLVGIHHDLVLLQSLRGALHGSKCPGNEEVWRGFASLPCDRLHAQTSLHNVGDDLDGTRPPY